MSENLGNNTLKELGIKPKGQHYLRMTEPEIETLLADLEKSEGKSIRECH